ncbi:MAG: ABC transporter ATP-binding protein [Spirochaetes bacterium]|nr:MAG: ABC transporter ATP-binding protein [Spirochaetota bacterium]RKX87499.1 MAG: ABC transporter ATP-binding protein [Spirochaetota bacterium]RKX92347.1 MAG: ABC transporter ATP-binding protein [Spirochaetota bacterium]
MASIELEKINKNFPGVKALNSVSQKIESGEFFTLLGPSGCGKTTLLRTIAGFYQQDSGHIYLSDKVIDNVPAFKRDTGMVFQSYAVFPHMTVYENVAFGLKTRKVNDSEIKERVHRALEQVHLTGYESRTPDQLSGGQQQRVGLARAMVIEPKVLLMDEPLSNLDAKLRVEMRTEIRNMQKLLGITTVYVTHDQEEALAISDKIAVMNFGVVQQVGTPWEIYKEPANLFVASFVGDINVINGASLGTEVGLTSILVDKNQSKENINIAIRPEELSIVTDEVSGDEFSCIPGVIEKSSFIGSLIRYSVDCGNDVTLTVELHKPQSEAFMPNGTSIFVKVPVKSILYFHSETGERI